MMLKMASARLMYAVSQIMSSRNCTEYSARYSRPYRNRNTSASSTLDTGPASAVSGHAALGIAKAHHVHRYGLRPAELEHDHHQQTHHVDMFERVERETPGVLRRRIAEAIRDPAVRYLVKRDAQQRRNDRQHDIEQI